MLSWMKQIENENKSWNLSSIELLPNVLRQEYSRLFELIDNENLFGVFLQTKDLFELLVKIPTISFLANEYIKDDIVQGDWLFRFFEKDLSFGDWNELGYYYATKISGEENVKTYFKNINKMIEQKNVIKWRNDWIGHGALAKADNIEFNNSLEEKIRELLFFIKENIDTIKEYRLTVIGSNNYEIAFGKRKISSTPWLMLMGDRTYFFDSYRANKKKTYYLDYENGGKLEVENNIINTFVNKLLAQNGVRTFIANESEEIIILNEEKMIRDLDKSQDYIRPEYLCSEIDEFMSGDKGIMLIQMPEGYGKTIFSNALDANGQGRIKPKNCMVRAYYANDTYGSNLSYFVSTINDVFRLDSEGKLIYRGLVPYFDLYSEDKSQALLSLLMFYKKNNGQDKILLVIDGLDEIKVQSDGSILEYLPNTNDIPQGVYIICTCRTNQELADKRELYLKINKMDFTRKLIIDSENENYVSILKEYIKKNLGVKSEKEYKAIIEAAEYKFRNVDHICKYMAETNNIIADSTIITDWNFEYLYSLFGEKFFRKLMKYCLYLQLICRPITINQLCLGVSGNNVNMQDMYFLHYLRDILQLDRNRLGNKISIKNESVSKWISSNYKRELSELAEQVVKCYLQRNIENQVVISQSIISIIDKLEIPINEENERIIMDVINSDIKEIDRHSVSNIPDLIALHQALQEVAKRVKFTELNMFLFMDDSIQAELLELYGMVGESAERYNKCIASVCFEREDVVVTFSDILIKYAILLDKIRNYRKAIEILDIIIKAEKHMNKITLGIALGNRAQLYFKMGDYQSAYIDLEKAIELLERKSEISDKYQLSLCYLNKSTIECNFEGGMLLAEKDVIRAIELTEKEEQYEIKVNKARALLNYAFILKRKDESLKKILSVMDDAIKILEDLDMKEILFDEDVLINAYCNKGIVLHESANKLARCFFEKAATLGESLMIQNRCYLKYELYKVYYWLLQYDSAYIEKIFNLLLSENKLDEGGYNWIFSALRDLVLYSYKMEEAYVLMFDYLKILNEKTVFLQDDIKNIIPALGIDLNEHLKKSGRYKESCLLLLRVINFMDNYEIDNQFKTLLKKEIGLLYIKQNELDDGIEYYKDSIVEFEQYYKLGIIQEIDEYIMVCANLGNVYLAQQKWKSAYDILLKALHLINEQAEKGKNINMDVFRMVGTSLVCLEKINL